NAMPGPAGARPAISPRANASGPILADHPPRFLGSGGLFHVSSRPRSWLNRAMEKSLPPLAPGTLYLVATPLGNLEDITLRALRTLKECDVVAAEDTRHSGQLLKQFGISKPLLSYFQFNEAKRTEEIIERLRRGERVALVTDAGSPGISDPGERVVKAAWKAGCR